jgi:hypothetical protein
MNVSEISINLDKAFQQILFTLEIFNFRLSIKYLIVDCIEWSQKKIEAQNVKFFESVRNGKWNNLPDIQ